MQTHFALRKLRDTRSGDVHALFAVRPQRKAILFVHGYSGAPIKTWSDFHELLPTSPKFVSHDLIFYGYDGLYGELNSSAAMFRQLLIKIFDEPASLLLSEIAPAAARPADFCYDEVMIVAHSLGAVIARRGLLDATRDQHAWVSRTKLILYAPAHKGAAVLELAKEVSSSFKFLGLLPFIAARFASPLMTQLEENSSELKDLLRDTEAATANGANPHLIATKVILAERERIVNNERFATDPAPNTIRGTTHTSVCKPSRDLRDALEHLERCL